jgi:hypothetical protein
MGDIDRISFDWEKSASQHPPYASADSGRLLDASRLCGDNAVL